MNCLICQKSLDDYTPLCAEHAPAWGESVSVGKTTVIVGELKLSDILVLKLMGHMIIRWWVGTDVWLLHIFPSGRGKLSVLKHRLIYHLTKFFVSENWVTSERLKDEFVACGGKKAFIRYHVRGMLTKKIEKKPHAGICIAYYFPKPGNEYQRWVYGYDLIKKLKMLFSEVNWIELDGSFDMRIVYSILDGVIRPNRHEGRSRMIEECKINDISFYHSVENPSLDDMCTFIAERIENKNESTY